MMWMSMMWSTIRNICVMMMSMMWMMTVLTTAVALMTTDNADDVQCGDAVRAAECR